MGGNKITFIYDARMSAYGINNKMIHKSGFYRFIDGYEYTVTLENSFGVINVATPYDFVELRGIMLWVFKNSKPEFTYNHGVHGFHLDIAHWKVFQKMVIDWVTILPVPNRFHQL